MEFQTFVSSDQAHSSGSPRGLPTGAFLSSPSFPEKTRRLHSISLLCAPSKNANPVMQNRRGSFVMSANSIWRRYRLRCRLLLPITFHIKIEPLISEKVRAATPTSSFPYPTREKRDALSSPGPLK